LVYSLGIISDIIKNGKDKMVCSDGGGVCLCLNSAQLQKSKLNYRNIF
jgi:hypothetical protein